MRTKPFLAIIFLASLGGSAYGQAELLLDETFEDNRNKWTLFERPFSRSGIANGVLALHVTDGDGGFFSQKHLQIDPYRDFILETEIEVKNFKHGSFGIVWGADESSNYQALDFTHSGFYHIYLYQKKQIITSKRPEAVSIPLENSGKHVLRIIKSGDNIGFALNGKHLTQLAFTPFRGTYIGFHLRGQLSLHVFGIKVYQEKAQFRQLTTSDNEVLAKKENLGLKINSRYSEKGVVVSPDGSTLYIARGEHPQNLGPQKRDDIWYSEKDSLGAWEKVRNIGPPLNNSGNNFVISVAPDGNNLLVANTYLADGQTQGGGVSLSRRTEKGWSLPRNLDIDDYYNEADFVDYCLSPNQKILLMALQRKDSKGDMDLYCSFLQDDDRWSAPRHTGPVINSFAMDFSPFIASDNETLYFSSYGHPGYGSADIFVSRRLDNTWTNWSPPENIGPQVNTQTWEANYTLDARGEYAYLASAHGSLGNTDIFRIGLPASARPKPVILVRGTVKDASTGKPLEAKIRYFSLAGKNEELGIATSHPVTGQYNIILPAGDIYGFFGEKDHYFPESAHLNAGDVTGYKELEQNLLLAPINVGVTVTLNNIFFDLNQARLLGESEGELGRVISLLENYPYMQLEIAGHTDSTGSEAHNEKLSLLRAEAVINYLAERGMGSRAIAKGYGASLPRAANTTEEGRRLNRRVEIIIRKM